MSREPSNSQSRADGLAHGIDPDSFGHDALAADIGRASDVPGSRQLDAGCIRAAYEAIAAAGDDADAADESVIASLRSGARAAADAVRVVDEIGAGAGAALRAAARAWYPYAVEAEATTWQKGLKAFSATCEGDVEADQDLLVRAIESAADATATEDTATGRATRAFSDELKRRISGGDDLPTSWSGAANHAQTTAYDPVFQTVVEAVQRVLSH